MQAGLFENRDFKWKVRKILGELQNLRRKRIYVHLVLPRILRVNLHYSQHAVQNLYG